MKSVIVLLSLCATLSAFAKSADENVKRCLDLPDTNASVSCLRTYQTEIIALRNECIELVFKNQRQNKTEYTRASNGNVESIKGTCRQQSHNLIRVETCIAYNLLSEAQDICE